MSRIQQQSRTESQYQQPQAAQAEESQAAQEAQQAAQAEAIQQQREQAAEQADAGRPDAQKLIDGRQSGRLIPGTRITSADNHKTFDVQAGENIILMLPANPGSSGYSWHIKQESRSLSLPAVNDFIANRPGAVGSGGTQQMIWKTGPMSVGMGQKVELVYTRANNLDDPKAKKFTFTVNVHGEASPNAGPGPGPIGGGHMGFVAPTHDQIVSYISGRVSDALQHHRGTKLSHAPAGLSKASVYDMTKPGREATIKAYVINNELYMKTQSMFPKGKAQWFALGAMPMW